MRCLERKPSFHEVDVGEKVVRYVTVLSTESITYVKRFGNWSRSDITRFQIKLIDNEKRHIVTNYTGKRANILKLKAGDYIKIEAIVKSHEEIDGIPVTLVSHIKNLSS